MILEEREVCNQKGRTRRRVELTLAEHAMDGADELGPGGGVRAGSGRSLGRAIGHRSAVGWFTLRRLVF